MTVGRNFVDLFDAWAPTYDQFVANREAEVFDGYEEILAAVTGLVGGQPGDWVLEVGSGTGNLSARLIAAGYHVIGVDPSTEMRRLSRRKLPRVPVLSGEFLSLPVADASFRAVVSSYAFHHLPEEDKPMAAQELLRTLQPGGRVIIADIAYEHELARRRLFARLRDEGRTDLLTELESEYYTTVGQIARCFSSRGCRTEVSQLTDWVWAVVATKPAAAWAPEI